MPNPLAQIIKQVGEGAGRSFSNLARLRALREQQALKQKQELAQIALRERLRRERDEKNRQAALDAEKGKKRQNAIEKRVAAALEQKERDDILVSAMGGRQALMTRSFCLARHK